MIVCLSAEERGKDKKERKRSVGCGLDWTATAKPAKQACLLCERNKRKRKRKGREAVKI